MSIDLHLQPVSERLYQRSISNSRNRGYILSESESVCGHSHWEQIRGPQDQDCMSVSYICVVVAKQ